MSDLFWPFILLLLGLGLLALELFVPSGGLLALMTAAALISSIVMAFYNGGPIVGTMFLVGIVVTLPALLAVAVRWWPETPLGRMVLIQRPREDEVLPKDYEELKELVGRRGVAKSPLLPSGAISIDGRLYDALSEGEAIERGQAVRVVSIRGLHIVVRPATNDIDSESNADLPSSDRDVLSRPAGEVFEDPFEEPLA